MNNKKFDYRIDVVDAESFDDAIDNFRLRDVVLYLRNNEIIDSCEVDCESLESIHNHSAWAYQQEG